ncbi:ABC transporter substrate-binding protein [Aquabacterium sp.]|uniref:ABC transporter substrate-binding protein n=1 Tax=Aquabacterium sp. TaxID=1872578 RepID=UPI002BC446B1|nr:ABC transporter substrate-binding protein [Aquabacterium sp.]HSW05367.1 ABC transporter substrate-binding protein [Aquabacterium sp.]
MKLLRRMLGRGLLALAVASPWAAPGHADEARKVLRFAFSSAETSFDPVKVNDLYSRTITPHIFEALYAYDALARPVKIRPLLAEAMPEVSADFKTWTVRLRRGIFFADDPAFQGKKRELVAQDFVYVFQRVFDPANKSPGLGELDSVGFVGFNIAHDEAVKSGKPFDYDRELPGIRALDRYTIRFTLNEPRPRLLETLAQSDLYGAIAREVVAFYGDKIDAHPVGTGPFRLKQWRRSSLIVLERSPDYREEHYQAEPAADDAEGQAILKRLKGRRLPMIDEVQVSIIDESQPRWLSFLNGQVDAMATQTGAVPVEFVNMAMPGGKLAPNLAKRGIVGRSIVNPDLGVSFFNMENPTVGGYTPEKIALRRAISLAYDVQREITIVRRGIGVRAQSPIVPHTSGYDPAFKSEMSDYDPARARALLDLYGYVDRDGDGYREMPDGSPLVLEMRTQPQQRSRDLDQVWKKMMDAVGIRIRFLTARWAENLKAARAGNLMMWQLGNSADKPDGQSALAAYYGPEIGGQNMARFKLPAFDRLYERLQALPDGPEREALFFEAKRLAVAYMPWKQHVHRVEIDLLQPWVVGYRRPLFWTEWWNSVDIDDSRRPAH